MKNIIFGITSLTLGGAEKVLIDIVNEIKQEYNITIFTLYSGGEFEKELSEDIKLKSLYKKPYNEMTTLKKILISVNLVLFKKQIYAKHIKGYDTEIAFLEGPITSLFSSKNKVTRKVAWVHTDISKIFGNSLKAKVKKLLNKSIYKKYDKIVFVSKDSLENFKRINTKIDKEKLTVINNYINSKNVIKKASEKIDLQFNKEEINLISVARLVEAKALDRLINVHSKLIEEGYKHKIYIIGDGPLRNDLKNQIKQNKVVDTFILLGAKNNPYPYIKNATYFVLLSYFEGYPMVLEEAKILDKFIITTNTASKEVLKDYENSIILENDEKSIYEGLKKVISNEYKEKVETKEKYNNSKLIEQIKKVIQGESI